MTHLSGRAVLGLLVLSSFAFFAFAGSASAAKLTLSPTVTPFYSSVKVSGSIDPEKQNAYYMFQFSTDQVKWSSFNYESYVDKETGVTEIKERDVGGLKPGTKYYVRMAAADFVTSFPDSSEQVTPPPYPSFTTKPVAEPTKVLDQPSLVTSTTARLTGSIDPELDPAADPEHKNAFEVLWWFECVPGCPGTPNYEYIAPDSNEHKVSLDVVDLLPGTKYEVTLSTQNAAGNTTTAPKFFTTTVIAPTVRTSQAHVTTTTANLSGSINPNGAETTYHFEYGPGFSQSTPTKTLFAGNVPLPVTANLAGLTPDTTYPFRLVAENSAGEVNSPDKAFTTQAEVPDNCPNANFRVGPSAALPDCRAYELVNPPGTDWSDIVRVWPGSDDGNHISYLTLVPPEIANSAVVASSFVSHRTDTGWQTFDANLRVKYVYGLDVSLPACFSSDYSHAIIDSPATINDQDQDGGGHDLARITVGNPFGEPLTYGEDSPDKQRGFSLAYLGGAPDLSRNIFYLNGALLTSQSPNGVGVYQRNADGSLEVLSRDTQGKVLNEVVPVGPFFPSATNCPTRQNNSVNPVSTDGTKVFYTQNYSGNGTIWRNDLTTGKIISVTQSHKTGDTSNPGAGGFQFATPDGNVVYFISGEQLTNDATPGGGIYRYEASTDTLEQISPAFNHPFGFQGAAYGSDADTRLYFNSERRLTPDAPVSGTHLYVWERGDEGGTPGPAGPSKGTTRRITTITDGGINRVSQNGRYMLLSSHNSLDGANNRNKNTIYMYDSETRDLACVSCRPNGTPNGNESNLANEPESLTFGIINPRNVSNDGRVFFNSSDRLIPADQTNSQDVYEFYRGRVYLITSGQGDLNQSYLADSSDDGSHVFFLTRSAFRPEDKDSAELDLYDAHIGGGFTLPKPVPPECEGEACRTSTSTKPEDAAPTTPNFSGAANPRPKRVRPKHHHKKKHHKKHHKKKQHKKRAGR